MSFDLRDPFSSLSGSHMGLLEGDGNSPLEILGASLDEMRRISLRNGDEETPPPVALRVEKAASVRWAGFFEDVPLQPAPVRGVAVLQQDPATDVREQTQQQVAPNPGDVSPRSPRSLAAQVAQAFVASRTHRRTGPALEEMKQVGAVAKAIEDTEEIRSEAERMRQEAEMLKIWARWEGSDTCAILSVFYEIRIAQMSIPSLFSLANPLNRYSKSFLQLMGSLRGLFRERRERSIDCVMDSALQKSDTDRLKDFERTYVELVKMQFPLPAPDRIIVQYRERVLAPIEKLRVIISERTLREPV
jgi:hypothetical protein